MLRPNPFRALAVGCALAFLPGLALASSHSEAPGTAKDRYLAALTATGTPVTQLSNGKLRVESNSDSIEWILELMRAHNLPPAEIVANPDALHELFIRSIALNSSDSARSPAPERRDSGDGRPPDLPASPEAGHTHSPSHGSQP